MESGPHAGHGHSTMHSLVFHRHLEQPKTKGLEVCALDAGRGPWEAHKPAMKNQEDPLTLGIVRPRGKKEGSESTSSNMKFGIQRKGSKLHLEGFLPKKKGILRESQTKGKAREKLRS